MASSWRTRARSSARSIPAKRSANWRHLPKSIPSFPGRGASRSYVLLTVLAVSRDTRTGGAERLRPLGRAKCTLPDILLRILWVKAGKLLPVDTGGKIRSCNILRHLSRTHEVTLLTYYGGARDEGYEADIAARFAGAATIYTAGWDQTVFFQSVDYLQRVFQAAPFAVSKFTHPSVARRIASWIANRDGTSSDARFDVAVCDFLSASQNFPDTCATPTVLFEHNVETMLWRRLAATESNRLRRAAYRIEAAKMARYELAALGKFDQVIAVSEHDRRQLLAMNPDCVISVVPTGVDTEKYTYTPMTADDPPKIVFLGSMDWEPNIDAVSYFSRDIFPRIRRQVPSAVFQIVGRNPHSSVRRLAGDFVEVTGTVASTVEYLRAAAVVVVPLRIGGGTRLKIFEAMGCGKAVISTSVGAEGLAVQNGRDLIVADEADAFADAVVRLLTNSVLREHYEQAAARLAAQFDWKMVAKQFADVLEAACRNCVIREHA
jgi:polysaccharide biosynthesis protein PslH